MIFKFYKSYLILILFLFSTIGLYAQSLSVTSFDGDPATSCFPGTKYTTVTPSDVVINVQGNYAPPAGATVTSLVIKHFVYDPGPAMPCGTFGTEIYDLNQQTVAVTPTGGTFDYDFTVARDVPVGPCYFHFIQIVVTFSDGSDAIFCNKGIELTEALPVELTSFKGNETQKTNTLNWQTAAEINNDYFEVERSVDGRDFEVIGMEEGNGTTTLSSRYQFIDHSPLKTGYYRLRQVDFDGAFEYSDIIVVEREDRDAKHDLIIYPNPVKDNMKIEYQTAKSQEATVSVMNMTGQILSVQNVTSQEGRNILDLNSADIPTGSYILRIDLGDKQLSKLFIK